MKALFFIILLIFALPNSAFSQKDTLDLPLINAVKTCDYSLVLTALQAGSDVNEKDITGKTPLHHAVFCGNPEVVALLLLHKANPFAEDQYSIQALGYAKLFDQTAIVNMLMAYMNNKEVGFM
jgi:ankyrin repeat protein